MHLGCSEQVFVRVEEGEGARQSGRVDEMGWERAGHYAAGIIGRKPCSGVL